LISQIFLENSHFLKKILSRFLSERQDIEDVVQETYLRAYKAEQHVAFAILTNGYRPSAIEGLTGDLLSAMAAVELTQPEPVSVKALDQLAVVTGTYESFDTVITVKQQGKQLMTNIVYKIDPLPPLDLELRHMQDADLGPLTFAPYNSEGRRVPSIVFLENNAQGIPQYVFNGGRQNRRTV